jgi:hypothetical protein
MGSIVEGNPVSVWHWNKVQAYGQLPLSHDGSLLTYSRDILENFK